jgi:hypothetical protein
MAGGVAQVVERLCGNSEALSSTPSTGLAVRLSG